MSVDAPVTQADEVEVQPQGTPDGGGGADNGGQPPATEEQYFLDVDERHRYKTREDAVAAVRQSGERIGQLTPWAEHAQRYGVNDPNTLPQIFDSYLQMRDRLQKLETQIAGNNRGQEPAAQSLSQQDKANVDYLEKHGFTRKEAIDKVLQDRLSPLEEKVNALQAQLGRSEELQSNAVVDAGRAHLADLMKTAGFPVDNADFNGVVEDSIIAWMEASSVDQRTGNVMPGSPLDRFYAGGSAMREIVAEGFKRFSAAASVLRQNADGQYQARKESTVTRTPRPLPRQGAPVPKEGEQPTAVKRAPGAGGIFTDPALHDKAWERMQEFAGR